MMNSAFMLVLATLVASPLLLAGLFLVTYREMRRTVAFDRRLAVPRRQAIAYGLWSERRVQRHSAGGRSTWTLGLALLRAGSLLAPVGAAERAKLAQVLRQAGFGQRDALSYFLSAKLASAAVLAAGASLWASGMESVVEHGFLVAVAALVGLVVGGIVPEYILRAFVARRARRMSIALPDALDLMVMCLESGLTFERGLQTVAEELKLYTLSGNPGAQHYRATIDLVRQIQQLSSSWSIEVARVRTDPLADFDSLAAFLPRMARLKQDLAGAPRRIPDLPDRLANATRSYLGSIDAVEERIERFKTGYAVVRNSVRYLPLAVANVTRQAQEANDGPLAQSVSTLAQGMNVYLAAPSQPGRERLDTEVERLREASVGYPPTLANALANMLAHAEVLLARQADTDALFQQATSNDVAALSGRLIDNLEFELSRRRALAARYESGVLAAIGVLAALWIGLAVHQRARGRSVAETAPRSVVAAAPPEPAVGTGHVPQRSIVRHNEPRGVDVEPVAAVPAPSIGFGAESAMLHRFLSERVGDNIASTADRIAARMDYLRQTQQKIRRVLQASEALPELPDGADLDDEIEASVTIAAHVRREINGIADLAKRLASYPGLPNGDTGRVMVDVNACIDAVVDATGADEVAEVTKRLGDVPQIFAYRTEIRLLLAQILENSVHAVRRAGGRRGSIKIDTEPRNDEIQITVMDNGDGVAPDRRSKIFAPFYTSRDGGMGLGLTLAGHLVKKYEGSIKLNSLPGQGTVTRITLPTGTSAP